MGTDRFRNTKDDCMSGCRSFGSNGYPCSQPRKISIGVLVDSSAGSRSKKQDDVTAPAERVCGKVNTTTKTSNGDGVEAVAKGKETVTLAHQTSPWVSTRPTHQLKPSSEVFGSDLPTVVPAGGGTCQKSNGVKAVPETHSVQFHPKQTSVLQSGDSKKERVGASSLTARCEISASAKDALEDKTNGTKDTRETLRTKLWDVLGTVSSPKKQVSQAPEAGVSNSIPENIDNEGEPGSKPRSNSDTIETSSECPHRATTRSVTRSLSKKKAPNKVRKNRTRNVPPTTFTRKRQENNIFSLKQGFSQGLDTSVIDGFPKSLSKKRVRKGTEMEAQRGACSPTMGNADEIHLTTDMHKTAKCAIASALGKIGHLRRFRPRTKDFEQPENETSIKDTFQPTAKKILEQVDNVNQSANGQHRNQLEDSPKSSLKKTVHPYLHSPTSETRTPSKSFSGSLQRASDGEQDDHVPAYCSPLASKSYHQKRDMGTESSDDYKDVDNSPLAQSESIIEEKDEVDELARSLSKGRDSMSTKDGSPMSEGRRSESPLPEIGVAKESGFMHSGSDRSQTQGDIKVNSPISTSQKGSDERSQGLPGQDQEDALANAITLFAAALEKVANKIKLVTSKRTSEVLTSVAEEICEQLQNAELQMQKDMGKMTSFTKSKRKRIEAAFVEQEEQLKLIYRRFRADVDQHLQECRSTVEEFEAEEMEFKGFMEKRRASQRKLLKQVEEAIETQLSDAERRITAVHKSARAKMVQLKYSIAECLKEGMLKG